VAMIAERNTDKRQNPANLLIKWVFLLSAILFSWCLTNQTLAVTLIPLTVKKGTNLIHITRQFCTSEYHWKEVAKINGLSEPYLIRPGDTLYVPQSLLKVEKLSAKVTSVFGGVYLLRSGKKLKQIKQGDIVLPGQTLVTEEDGFTHLVFPDHKYTRISSGSKFTLTYLVRLADQSLKAEFFLERGKITHAVKEQLKANDTFTTRTPVSVTGVRGTEYRLKMQNAELNLVETLKGGVAVDASGTTILVKKGKGTRVAKGKAPEPPRSLPSPPEQLMVKNIYRVLPVILQTADRDGVAALRLRISTDREGQKTILEQLVKPGDNFRLLALDDGIYHGFLTALDSEGFESMPSDPFNFQVRTVPIAPLLKDPLNGRSSFEKSIETAWLHSEQAVSYTVQLARDDKFTSLVDEQTVQEPGYKSPELEPGEYFFRVQAKAADGFTSLFSLIDSWEIVAQPDLNSVDGSRDDGIMLQWADMGAGMRYDVQIAPNNSFSNRIVEKQGLHEPKFNHTGTLEPGSYYVRIRGVLNDGQQSPWSPAQKLVIDSKPFGLVEGAILVFFGALMLL
ncbi:MAG: FecR domain-containing protein, partial [Desulforhopalus sp.]